MEMSAPRGKTLMTVSSFLFYKCVFDEMFECVRDYETFEYVLVFQLSCLV